MRVRHLGAVPIIAMACAVMARGGSIIVHAPAGATVASARAVSTDGVTTLAGKPDGTTAILDQVPPSVPVNVQLTLADSTELQGVDLRWYGQDPAPADATPLTDEDREAVRTIVQDIPSFYNKSSVLLLAGDHSRATALVQLVRDSDFHSGGGNVVWRVELYYFKFQYGGWEKVQQQNKIVRRERFKSVDAYKQATDKLKWVPELGGITVGAAEKKEITLKAAAPKDKD